MREYVSRKEKHPGYAFETVDYDHFQIIAVQEGMLHFRGANGMAVEVRAGAWIFLKAHSRFRLWCHEMAYSGIGIGLHPETEGEWSYLMNTFPQTRYAPTPEPVRQLLELIRDEIDKGEKFNNRIVHHLREAILFYVRRIYPPVEGSVRSRAEWVETAKLAIQRNLYADRSLQAILSRVPISYAKLSTYFREECGITLKQYQMQLRLNEAREFLVNTSLPIDSIALELGFSSQQHFTSCFTRTFGISPARYRRQFGGHPTTE